MLLKRLFWKLNRLPDVVFFLSALLLIAAMLIAMDLIHNWPAISRL